MANPSQSPSTSRPTIEIRPQPGPQERFLSTPADIAIYGGGAGGGKTWALLLEPLRHINNKDFDAVIFRRTSPQIRNPGGLWDASFDLYPCIGGAPKQEPLEWKFPSGAKLKFAHMEHEKNKLDWQGSEVPFIGFDELTHFTETQFFYMLSRNRSMSGIRPYIRATCNPDAGSWVAQFIAWWIDQRTGIAIPERSGVLRWFVRVNDLIVWGDSPAEIMAAHPEVQRVDVKSATFIVASIHDNRKLIERDPGYLGNLRALPQVERERLLGGNWRIRDSESNTLVRSWWKVWTEPEGPKIHSVVLSFDTAFKDGLENDYTAMTAWGLFTPKGGDPDSDFNALLIRAWQKRLRFPALVEIAKSEANDEEKRYGGPPEHIVIEDKASGQSLIQTLHDAGVDVFPYNPGKESNIQRAHAASSVLKSGGCWVLGRRQADGTRSDTELVPAAEMVVSNCEMFPTPDVHDDLCTTVVQALMYMKDCGYLRVETDVEPADDDEEIPEPRRSIYG